jgi:hypothetical protein
MALTPAQLQHLVDGAGAALQQIQDELGRDGPGGKVRFPAGYIATVAARTPMFLWIGDEALKRNICYHLIFADVLRWLLNRTTLGFVARDMVVKHSIAVMGAIVEGVTVAAMTKLGQPIGRFPGRLQRLLAAGAIDGSLRIELEWLWGERTKIHIHEVEGLEIDRYPIADGDRATTTARALCDRLATRFV